MSSASFKYKNPNFENLTKRRGGFYFDVLSLLKPGELDFILSEELESLREKAIYWANIADYDLDEFRQNFLFERGKRKSKKGSSV